MGLSIRQRRLHAIKQGNLSAISERDVNDIAAIFLRDHGPRAARQAGEWADLMLDRGDRNGHATWRRILWAIEELRHRGRCQAESQPSTDRPSLRVQRLYSDIDKPLEPVIRKAHARGSRRGTGRPGADRAGVAGRASGSPGVERTGCAIGGCDGAPEVSQR
jgi:hypothetical protein